MDKVKIKNKEEFEKLKTLLNANDCIVEVYQNASDIPIYDVKIIQMINNKYEFNYELSFFAGHISTNINMCFRCRHKEFIMEILKELNIKEFEYHFNNRTVAIKDFDKWLEGVIIDAAEYSDEILILK